MMLRICIFHIMPYFIATAALIALASFKSTYFVNCYHFLIDFLLSKGFGNVNGILMPMACILSDKKLHKIIFGRTLHFLKNSCPASAKEADEETQNVLSIVAEKPGNEEADQRILDLESAWDKAFEMRSLRK